MKTSIITRIACLIGAVALTFIEVQLVARYGFPASADVVVAKAK